MHGDSAKYLNTYAGFTGALPRGCRDRQPNTSIDPRDEFGVLQLEDVRTLEESMDDALRNETRYPYRRRIHSGEAWVRARNQRGVDDGSEGVASWHEGESVLDAKQGMFTRQRGKVPLPLAAWLARSNDDGEERE
ncbi:hypothetical protein WN51_00348 [Melipona quadrifasciata]|uniref:Uncharacterized protein n=1 Tax=Melipona quadrifasciata TaxID=166423 RepID=A0A0M8ZY04_9HYME|nr:hypothetical protein WN51_00348 [Melipona quadrifasciata]